MEREKTRFEFVFTMQHGDKVFVVARVETENVELAARLTVSVLRSAATG